MPCTTRRGALTGLLTALTLLATILPVYSHDELFNFIKTKSKGGHCCTIRKERLWSKVVSGLDNSSFAILKPLLEYKHYLPLTQLKAGLESYGASRRLRKFVSRLLEGTRPLKIGAVGGSIGWGQGATCKETRWFNIFTEWLASVHHGSNVTARNGCIPASPSAYMLMCLQDSVDPDVDLMFVEYSVNDGVTSVLVGSRIVLTMEQLLRRILELPSKPAVVMVQVPHVWAGAFEPFYHTSEDMEGALNGYYDVPGISLRNALYPLAALYPTNGFLWNQTYNGIHPGDSGHKILADLAVHLIQETARDLILDPLTKHEELELNRPVPEPMYPGNLPPTAVLCLTAEGFRILVTDVRGWTWVNEMARDPQSHPKWGYLATEPGSILRLQLDTRWKGVPVSDRLPLLIHYRKSNRDLGMARAECLSGCTCEPLVIDAGLRSYHSQLVMVATRVTQHRKCVMQLSLLRNTSTGGTKFLVAGVSLVGTTNYKTKFYEVDFWSDQHDISTTQAARKLPS